MTEQTPYKDKNGAQIRCGDKACIYDKSGKRWEGTIIALPESEHDYALRTNYNIWLHSYWTETGLERL